MMKVKLNKTAILMYHQQMFKLIKIRIIIFKKLFKKNKIIKIKINR